MNFLDFISGIVIGMLLSAYFFRRTLENDVRRIIDMQLNKDMDMLCDKYRYELIKREIIKE